MEIEIKIMLGRTLLDCISRTIIIPVLTLPVKKLEVVSPDHCEFDFEFSINNHTFTVSSTDGIIDFICHGEFIEMEFNDCGSAYLDKLDTLNMIIKEGSDWLQDYIILKYSL